MTHHRMKDRDNTAGSDGDDRPKTWSVRASSLTLSCNPIRIIVDELVGRENPKKELRQDGAPFYAV